MKKILIDRCKEFTRTAVTENGKLIDLVIDKHVNESIAGNIYLGVVKCVLPNEFAFVDIGQQRNAFLNALNSDYKKELRVEAPIIVQVCRDPSGDKGASLSTRMDLTGRLCVLLESLLGESGVSHKIKSGAERERLKKILKRHLPKGFSAIARTDSENKSEEEIAEDINKLRHRYERILTDAAYKRPPALLYRNNSSALFELLREDVEEILINDKSIVTSVMADADACLPGASKLVRLSARSVFDSNVEKQISRALEKKIWLNNGGFLIIEQTAACVIIDVNSGKFTGGKDGRDNALRTNLEAAKETAMQIRLRNLSGMIIIDFINMDSESDKSRLYDYFQAEIAKDRIKTNIIGMTELGLMQLTRKKTRESLMHILMEPCSCCHGEGYVRA
ncbi:MAG: Rne/Rng family ribonuclease [Clostridiales bacterium]|nr:Rne/Rng family ribonuclease [Clostridiales bacterium]